MLVHCTLQLRFIYLLNYVVKVRYRLRLLLDIKKICHNDAKIEWSSDEDS